MHPYIRHACRAVNCNLNLNLNLSLTRCNDETEEDNVKDKSKEEALAGATEEATCATSVAGKTLCIPFEQPDLPEGTKCFASGLPAKCWVLWGRSY